MPTNGFLSGGGEMGARIRDHDWSGTRLGPVESWPQSLRSALSICLNASFPIAIYWGPDLELLYNDAWSVIPAERHPWCLGRPAAEVWSDIWDVVGPQMQRVLQIGEGFSAFDEQLMMVRGGVATETYWTYSFTPVRGEDGRVVGIFNQGNETTAHVLGERRGRFLLDLTDRLRALSDPGAIIQEAQTSLGVFLGANRVGYGEVEPTGRYFTTTDNWTDGAVPPQEGTYDLSAFGEDIWRSLKAGVPQVVGDTETDPRTSTPQAQAAFAAISTRAFITASLVKDGRMRAALYAHAREPRTWTAGDAQIVVEVADRTWSAAARARAQAALSESQARLSAVIEALPVGVGVIDLEGRAVLSNPELRRFMPNDLIPSRDDEQVWRWRAWDAEGNPVERADFPGARALRGEHVVPGMEMLFTNEEGRDVWINVATVPVLGADGRMVNHVVAIMDIDALKRGAEALRISETRLRELNETLERRVDEALAERKLLADLVEGADALVQVVDPDLRILAINRATVAEVERLFGVRLRVGDALFEKLGGVVDAERSRSDWTRALAGETFREVRELHRPDGTPVHFEMNFSPLRDVEGRIIGAYQFAYDITERVRDQQRLADAELALHQSQKMEAMGQLTGGVAHDFNNLLTPIIGSLDMLQRRGVGGDREQRLVAAALQSADRAKTLVQRLLAFARRQPLQAVSVDVAHLVESMAELVASTTGPQIRVTVEAPPDLPPAVADPNQLEMALLNLSVNARDAMPNGGSLRISASAETIPPSHSTRLPPGDYIRLSVADTGVGMDAAVLARAIEPFFSTKGIGKGTGLGLSMVHGLASQLGGALTIRSEPGLGTNVELWLPQSDEAPEATNLCPVDPTQRQRGVALLVDDEDLVRLSTAEMLGDLGYDVVEAASAEAALRLIEQGLGFDLLVTDHLMPGMTGADLAREIQAQKPGAQILVVSGYAESESIDQDLPRLTKPFRKAELAASLATLS